MTSLVVVYEVEGVPSPRLGDPAFTVDDDTPVVLERFRLLDRP